MILSKEQLRKIHGIAEPSGPEDPGVLTRRKYHEASAKWLARYYSSLQAIFAIIGFVFILLPALSKSWRTTIENIPVVITIFHDYATLNGLAMANFYLLITLFLLRNWKSKHLPGGEAIGLDYQNIVAMELYPRTKHEESAYWIDLSFSLAASTFWLFMPFGLFAYFIYPA